MELFTLLAYGKTKAEDVVTKNLTEAEAIVLYEVAVGPSGLRRVKLTRQRDRAQMVVEWSRRMNYTTMQTEAVPGSAKIVALYPEARS